MATPIADLVVRFRGDRRHYDSTVRHVERGNARLQKGFRRLRLAGAAAFAGTAAAAVASVRAFASFDAAMTQSLAIMGNVSDTMREDMVVAARQVARTTTTSATEAANAYFFLASAGLNAEQSIAALPQVAAFAQAGMFDMSTATDLATDAQSALGLTVDDTAENLENLTRITDVLVRANTLANATVEQFSTALTTEAGAALKTFGIDVEEGVAVLAAFADQGIKGQRAGAGFSRVLRLMSQAAVNNRDEMAALGLEFFDAEGGIRDMADIVEDLTRVLGGMSDEQRTAALESIGFTARVQGIIQPLLGTSDAIREYDDALRDAAGTTRDVSENQLKSFAAQMEILKNRVIITAQEIGETLAPAVLELSETFVEHLPQIATVFVNTLGTIGLKVTEFIQHLPPIISSTAAAGGLIGLVFLGPLGLAAGVTIGAMIDSFLTKLGRAAGGGAVTVFEALADQQERLLALRDQIARARERGDTMFGETPIEEALANVDRQLDMVARSIRTVDREFVTVGDTAKTFFQKLADWKATLGAGGGEDTPVKQVANDLAALPKPVRGISDSMGIANLAIEHGVEKVRELGRGTKNLGRDLHTLGVGIAHTFSDTLVRSLSDGRDAFKSFADFAIQQLLRLAAQFAVFQTLNAIPGLGSLAQTFGQGLGFVSPAPAGGGGGATASTQTAPQTASLDVSGMPPARNPLASERDNEWLSFLHRSNLALKAQGA